jgi:hypothetical protein
VDKTRSYHVVTMEGKTVGRVAGESKAAFVVECGTWPRKTWRALPKQFASVDKEESCVRMQVSKEILARSPRLKQDVAVDDEAVTSWWGLD